MFIGVYRCLLMFIDPYSCIDVYWCLLMFIFHYCSLLIFIDFHGRVFIFPPCYFRF